MEVIVEKDKKVRVRSMYQYLTYGGLLEGLPTDKMNARILQDLVKIAQKQFHIAEVYVIEPLQKPIEYEGRYPFGTPQQLPQITCMAKLRNIDPARDKSADYSELTIVWFQDSFAFPIQEDVVNKLAEIRWNKLAGDYEW